MPPTDTITITLQSTLRTCVDVKFLCPLPCVRYSRKFVHPSKRKLSSRWKIALQLRDRGASIYGHLTKLRSFLVKAVTTILQLDKALPDLQEEKVNIDKELLSASSKVSLDDLKETHPKEYKRRLRISKANKGKVSWNKGKKHKPETIVQIRERTRQAMQDPKVRKKLLCRPRHTQSEETRLKIAMSVKRAFNKRHKEKQLQETFLHEWKESIAEAARIGGDGEDELQWDAYDILEKMMLQDGLQLIEMRKNCRTAPKTVEHKKKISEAIKAKWEDPEWRKRVLEAMKTSPELKQQ